MSTSLTKMAQDLNRMTEWQKTPYPLNEIEYLDMVIDGVKELYIITNRPSLFDGRKIYEQDGELFYEDDLPINERYFALLCAQIGFFKKVQADVNNIVGYSTDALTVTNADKPYANLKNSIDDLEKEKRIVYYKMVSYTL